MKDWEKRRQERRSDYEAGKKYSKKALEILTETPQPEDDVLVDRLAAHPLHSKQAENIPSEPEGTGEKRTAFPPPMMRSVLWIRQEGLHPFGIRESPEPGN